MVQDIVIDTGFILLEWVDLSLKLGDLGIDAGYFPVLLVDNISRVVRTWSNLIDLTIVIIKIWLVFANLDVEIVSVSVVLVNLELIISNLVIQIIISIIISASVVLSIVNLGLENIFLSLQLSDSRFVFVCISLEDSNMGSDFGLKLIKEFDSRVAVKFRLRYIYNSIP